MLVVLKTVLIDNEVIGHDALHFEMLNGDVPDDVVHAATQVNHHLVREGALALRTLYFLTVRQFRDQTLLLGRLAWACLVELVPISNHRGRHHCSIYMVHVGVGTQVS